MTNIPTLIAELRRLGDAASNRPHNVKCEFISTAKPPSFNDENQACHATLAAFECANAVPLLVDEVERQQERINHLESRLEAVRCCMRGVAERYADGSYPLNITGTINSILSIDDDCEARFAAALFPDPRGVT